MYEIVVVGGTQRRLRVALEDLVDEWGDATEDGNVVVRTTDQSRLVAVIDRLHDLGITIEEVHQR